jgi:hypothetical protein
VPRATSEDVLAAARRCRKSGAQFRSGVVRCIHEELSEQLGPGYGGGPRSGVDRKIMRAAATIARNEGLGRMRRRRRWRR